MFAQVEKFLVQKVKDIMIFAAKLGVFFKDSICLPIPFCVCHSHKSRKLAEGKFAVRKGKKQGRHREFKNAI